MPQFFLLLSLLFSFSLSAQLLTGARAANVIPEAHVIRYDGDQSLPQFIRLQEGLELPVTDAPAFLKAKLRLPADHDFEFINVQTDKYNIQHHRYRQTVGGHPVIGGVYIFHGKNGNWTEANGELHLPENGTASVILTPGAALTNVMQDRPAEIYGWETEHPIADYPTPQLTWVSTDLSFRSGTFRLAYEIFLYRLNPHSHERLFLDAATGEIIASENQLQTYHDHGGDDDVDGQAKTRYSGLRPIKTTFQGDSTFVLQETGRGDGIYTYNSQGRVAYPYVNFEDDDNYWENVNAQRDEVATDCHWATEKYHDLLRYHLDRNSIDDQGEALESHVHYDQNYGNAFWDGRRSTFGDGDPNSGIELPSVTLDVVAHEFTHGLTDRTSDLIYAEEYGALNESFSDILGIATVFIYRPEDATWAIGADLSTDGQGIRNMRDPGIFNNPQTYRGDNWTDGAGVHTNSSVQNHWFYLLATGGNGENELGDVYNIPGLGLSLALEIAYRNNAFYLTETSEYADAGFNSTLAATAIFGSCSPEVDQVIEAWKAVGVYVPEIPTEATADFYVNGPFCSLTDSVTFNNTSFGDSFVWDFGDGTTSTERAPKHLYATPGSYTVSLTVENCHGSVAEFTQPAAVILDPGNVYCDAVTMPTDETMRVVDCRGVLYDTGGPNGRYSNNESSVIVIENPLGTPIELNVVFFQSQPVSDQLIIYNGDTDSDDELAVLSGLRNNLTIQSTSPVVTLNWVSNGDQRGVGWEIRWGGDQSNSAPDASFSASTTNALPNELITISSTAPIPGPVTYNFGDGTPSITSNTPVDHAYDQPGTYEVMAIDFNCTAADTITQTITVGAGTSFTIAPNSLSETLVMGQQTTQNITVVNDGTNNGFYQANFPDFEPQTITSVKTFNISNRTTRHTFSDLQAQLENVSLNIAVDGDFGTDNKTADVIVEGETIGTVGGLFTASAFQMSYRPSLTQLANWLADGEIEVEVVSANAVSTIGFSNIHAVSIDFNRVPYLTGNSDRRGIALGMTQQLAVLFDATELEPATYLDTIFIRSSDLNDPITAVPVSLEVLGIARMAVSTEIVDFGFLAPNQSRQQQLTISNVGTADLSLNGVAIDNDLFTANFSPSVLAPGEEYVLNLDLNVAMSLGTEQGLLSILSNLDTRTVQLTAFVGDDPSVNLITETLSTTLATNTTTTEPVELTNDSPATPLNYDVEIFRQTQRSSVEFTDDNDTTFHVFTNLATPASYEVEVILQGDFSSSFERTRLIVNGELNGFIDDNNIPDNEPDTVLVTLHPRFFLTGNLNITLVNASTVRWEEEYANLITVNLRQTTDVPWLTQLAEVTGPLAAGQPAAVPYEFNAAGLLAGNYFATLKFTSNDPDEPERLIPVQMNVTGTPVLAVSDDNFNFYGLELGLSYRQDFTYRNNGSAILNLTDISSDNDQFTVTVEGTDLRPGESGSGSVTYTPTTIGVETGTITLGGDDFINQAISVSGEGITTAMVDLIPDTVCVSLLAGTDTTFTGLSIGNAGPIELRYHFGRSTGELLVWDYAQNLENFNNGIGPVLDNYGDDISVGTLSTTDPTEMTEALMGIDILVIAPMENPDEEILRTMSQPIRRFMNRGGRVLITGGQEGEVPFNLGILSGSAIRTNPGGIPINRSSFNEALFAGITDTILTSTEETNYIVGYPGGAVQTVGRMYGQACMFKGTRGRGGFIYLGYTFEETSEQATQVLSNAIGLVIGSEDFPDWLAIDNTSGTLIPGEEDDRTITITTGELAAGDYFYDGAVSTNAPGTTMGNYVVKLTVFLETAVEDAATVERLVIYPNPANGPVYLDLELITPQALNWNLTDAVGRLVLHGNLPEAVRTNQVLLNASRLPAGTYQLQLRGEKGEVIAIRRMVIE